MSTKCYVIGTGSPPLAEYVPETKELYNNVKGFNRKSILDLATDKNYNQHESQAASEIVKAWPDADITHVRCLDGNGSGKLEWFYQALQICKQMGGGAVINASLGVALPHGGVMSVSDLVCSSLYKNYFEFFDVLGSNTLSNIPIINEIEAISADLVQMGCVLVASSGNSGTSTPLYPAQSQHWIAVGSEQNGNMSSFSNKGAMFATDGEDDKLFGYKNLSVGSGTSFSGPDVAGIIGRMWQERPELRQDDFINILPYFCRHKSKDKKIVWKGPNAGWGSLTNWYQELKGERFNKFFS